MTVSVARYGVQQLYLYPITDPTVGAPVYGSGLRAACVRKVAFPRAVTEAILEGDDSICLVSQQTKALDFEIEFGGAPLDVQAMIQGATLVEDAGPPVTSHLVVGINDVPAQFGLIARVIGRSGGFAHLCLFNNTELGGGPEEAAMDTFAMSVYKGKSIPSPVDEASLYGVKHWEAGTTLIAVDTTWANNDVTDVTP